jgi:membrane protease YdiL (CAAX protease family)
MFNLNILEIVNFVKVFTITFILLIGFYYYFKKAIFEAAPKLASKTTLIYKYPYSQVVGLIELFIVATFHVLFCIALLYFFNVDARSIFLNVTITDCLFGVLIGIGSMGTSTLLCTTAMKLVDQYSIRNGKKSRSLKEWYAISSAGWIRHHKHNIQILPLFLALIIITMQVGSEETIFRSVLFQAYAPFGIKTAFIISTLLFIYMQVFHMPSMLSAMFPMIGAFVMGIVHGILYIYHPTVVPLIISHIAFFIFTII